MTDAERECYRAGFVNGLFTKTRNPFQITASKGSKGGFRRKVIVACPDEDVAEMLVQWFKVGRVWVRPPRKWRGLETPEEYQYIATSKHDFLTIVKHFRQYPLEGTLAYQLEDWVEGKR